MNEILDYEDDMVVTHQWSGDPSIWSESLVVAYFSRNSPMIWWPFNSGNKVVQSDENVVTHQWSGDPSINPDRQRTIW